MDEEFRIENYELKAYAGSDKNIAVPEGVRKIAYGAFSGKENLVSVVLPDSRETIDLCAFSDCRSLASINFPRNLVCIKNSTFENCVSLSSIKFPDVLEYIGNSAFESCENLVSVVFDETDAEDNGVLVMGNSAFNGCGFCDDGRMKIPCGMNADNLKKGCMYEPEKDRMFVTYGRDVLLEPGTCSFCLSGSCRGFDGYNIDDVTSDELKLALCDEGDELTECVDWNRASLKIKNLCTQEEHIFYVNSDMNEPLFYGNGKFYSAGLKTFVHYFCLLRQTGNDNAEVCYGEARMEKEFVLSDFLIDFHYYPAADEGIFSGFKVMECSDVPDINEFFGNSGGWIFNGNFE